jgi:hypothetical protein
VTRERRGDVYSDQLGVRLETRQPSDIFATELETRLSQDLGLSVVVELVSPGALAGDTRADSEGERKVRRILDLRENELQRGERQNG